MLEQFRERYLRKSRKLTDIFPIAAIISFVLALIGQAISLAIGHALGLSSGGEIDPNLPGFLYMTLLYLSFISIWLIIALAIAIPPANRRMFKDILPNGRGNSLRGIGIGILLGFSCNAICILLSVLLRDVGLSFAEFNIVNALILYLAVMVQSGAEEIVDRLFLYEKLRRRYKSPWVAIIGNALVFISMHLLNTGITVISCMQIALIGVIFSLFVYYFDSLWAAIFFHTTWNYTQNILFGCPNSGIVSAYSIFKLDAASWGPFFDPVFGVEGSIGANVILAALLVGILVYAKKKNLPGQDLWADLNEPAPEAPAPEAPAGPETNHTPRHMNSAAE